MGINGDGRWPQSNLSILLIHSVARESPRKVQLAAREGRDFESAAQLLERICVQKLNRRRTGEWNPPDERHA